MGLLELPLAMQWLSSALWGMSPSNYTVMRTVKARKRRCSKGNWLPKNNMPLYPLTHINVCCYLLEGLVHNCTSLAGEEKEFM